MARILIAAIALIALLGFASADSTPAIAQVTFRTGSISGVGFFAQNITDGTVDARLTLYSGYNVNSNYSFFVMTYGDLYSSTSHGACFSAGAFGWVTPDVASNYYIQHTLDSGVIDLIGASTSIIGRTIAIYENLAGDACSNANAATPVARGVVGTAYPGLYAADVNPAGAPLTSNPTSAYAEIVGTTGTYGDNSGISGSVYFAIDSSSGLMNVLVQITQGASTISNGQHALHVHEYGDLSMSNATSAGGHWNPWHRNHGAPPGDRHEGDMGNVTASSGTIYNLGSFNILTFQGIGSIIGRGVVLHTLKDDGNPDNTTASVGNAGGRIARGVIGISSRSVPYTTSSSSSTGLNGAVNMASLSYVTIVIAAIVAFFANKQ